MVVHVFRHPGVTAVNEEDFWRLGDRSKHAEPLLTPIDYYSSAWKIRTYMQCFRERYKLGTGGNLSIIIRKKTCACSPMFGRHGGRRWCDDLARNPGGVFFHGGF